MWAQIGVDDSVVSLHVTKPEMHSAIEFIDITGGNVAIGDILNRSTMTFETPEWKNVQDDSIGEPVDDSEAGDTA